MLVIVYFTKYSPERNNKKILEKWIRLLPDMEFYIKALVLKRQRYIRSHSIVGYKN